MIPLFISSKSQEIFQCVADEHVTEDNPHKLIPKDAIIQDMRERAAVSDFHPVKQLILVGFAVMFAYIGSQKDV